MKPQNNRTSKVQNIREKKAESSHTIRMVMRSAAIGIRNETQEQQIRRSVEHQKEEKPRSSEVEKIEKLRNTENQIV